MEILHQGLFNSGEKINYLKDLIETEFDEMRQDFLRGISEKILGIRDELAGENNSEIPEEIQEKPRFYLKDILLHISDFRKFIIHAIQAIESSSNDIPHTQEAILRNLKHASAVVLKLHASFSLVSKKLDVILKKT